MVATRHYRWRTRRLRWRTRKGASLFRQNPTPSTEPLLFSQAGRGTEQGRDMAYLVVTSMIFTWLREPCRAAGTLWGGTRRARARARRSSSTDGGFGNTAKNLLSVTKRILCHPTHKYATAVQLPAAALSCGRMIFPTSLPPSRRSVVENEL